MTSARPLPGPPPARLLDAAGALYLAGVRARRPLDGVTAQFLRDRRDLRGAERGFVVDTAQGMLRARRRIEAAVAHLERALGAEPTRGALACLYLVGARGADPALFPVDGAGRRALREAWAHTDALPLDVRASLPGWLVQRLLQERGEEAGTALCLALVDAPPATLRANRLRSDPDRLVAALAAEGHEAHRCTLSPDGVRLEQRGEVFSTRAFHDGLFEMQDEGSQLVSLLCEAKPGMTVVDGCAGAGGKTLHLAAEMQNKGTLYALEPNARRRGDLSRRAARARVHNLRVDTIDRRKKLAGRADVVLVDAPCSGSGVLRRNPDTSWTLSPDDVLRLTTQQAEILAAHAPVVAVGGRLVYATCSLLASENRAIVDAFLAAHPAFAPEDAGEILARRGVRLPGKLLDLDPAQHGTDGFFAAVLRRAD